MTRYMPLFSTFLIGLLLVLAACHPSTPTPAGLAGILEDAPAISGKESYLGSPYVTAGDRVYMVGHQDGTFPELGWHITGEMGGIWDHPIKLMDGFEVALVVGEDTIVLDKADEFINYPMANRHRYLLPDQQLEVNRWQFVPDGREGIAIQVDISNQSEELRTGQIIFRAYTDLRPTWLGERTDMVDGTDAILQDPETQICMARDAASPWFVAFGMDVRGDMTYRAIPTPYAGKGAGGELGYSLTLPAGKSIPVTITIAGSYQSEKAALVTYRDIQTHYMDFAHIKKARYEGLAQRSRLSVPDADVQQAFEWLKYNCDWLIRSVPEVGTGITAGIPDYPWWFGVDSEYALKGYMAVGQKQPTLKTIALLDSLSRATNDNGRMVHEVSTNGAVFNPGNINETPQFASLIWEVFRWTGDTKWLAKYYPTIKKGLTWLTEEQDTNGNGFPEGFGMMEIHGLDSEMIDVAAYTQRAMADAGRIASVLGEAEDAAMWKQKAAALAEKINQDFWSEEFGSYADFIGTDAQALHLIEDAIVRADTLNKPWAVAELEATRAAIKANPSQEERPFVLHHNWVVNTPMEMEIADAEKALRALETAKSFVNPFGVFVTGIDRDESAGSDDGSFKGSKVFSYTGAVMTLPTGVQVVAENAYGRPDEALNYLRRMTRTFSYALPGSIYEVSPDYGMITQAWNIYSFGVPIVQQFFGIQPYAHEKKVIVSPQMPSEWEEASLENVAIAENQVSVFYQKDQGQTELILQQMRTEWSLLIPFSAEKKEQVSLEGGEWVEIEGQYFAKATERKMTVKYAAQE